MEKRIYDEFLIQKLKTNKIFIVKGPKHSQKSRYLANVIERFSSVKIVNCEDKRNKPIFKNQDHSELQELFGNERFVILKEAQTLDNLQAILENVLFDNAFSNSFVLSCSFDPVLVDELVEALKLEDAIISVYPPLFQELANEKGVVQFDKELDKRLIYGNYPQVLDSEHPETELMAILDKTIFTNLNPTERINKGDKLRKMLQYISFELGEPLSYNEIAEDAGLDNETVERYVDLLERSFVLIRIPSFYNGNKYELKKTHTFYFLDNGVRNALIKNFNELDLRVDIDKLWKNWLIAEKIKWNKQLKLNVTYYFWRTHTRQHIDFIEVSDNQISAYKSLWDKRKKPKFPTSFKTYYPTASLHALNRATYWAFLTKKK
ncbi:MAG TPA: DUF4143 domain-containing protein [Crocinitomicaceae bacterium]|nr:DUF4143 domain-containing protein [Crocinitomicaceae bacterium]